MRSNIGPHSGDRFLQRGKSEIEKLTELADKKNAINGEVLEISSKAAEIQKKMKVLQNLFGTEAGAEAMRLDAADGTQDTIITKENWDNYLAEKGYDGNTVETDIGVIDAMNSITTYMVEAEAKANEVRQAKEEGGEDAGKFGL